ncbi:MAG: pseudouridine synthase [Synergistales bacterium]|jgi:23S rRNA pseudouridine2605 synthase|nr:pseudouridine synthase [Synergistales bacterium]
MTTGRESEGERLNRYLARCGIGSRRKVEAFVFDGRIHVDGRIALSPGERVGGESVVTLDGRALAPQEAIYLVMNKPRGVVCAVTDRFDRTVIDLLPSSLSERKLFPVGRLDKESEGLLLLTNDGDFAQQILHPRYGIVKSYEARLDGPLSEELLERWRRGVQLDEGFVVPVSLERVGGRGRDWITLSLREGLKREIRRMAEALGFRVLRLRRLAIGCLALRDLPVGDFLEIDGDRLWKMIKSGGIL